MEKDNDKVIKITKGKIKLAGLLLGLTLTAAGGYAISKSGSSEKEQLSVETEVDLEDEIKTEENVVLADEIIVEEILDDGIYQKDEIDSLYLAAYLLPEGSEQMINITTVKEVSISDVCARNNSNNKDITYGEYYLGDDCYNIFGDGSTKKDNSIKLYISVKDDSLVNIINYKTTFKNANFLSERKELTEEELKLVSEDSNLDRRLEEVDILGVMPRSIEPFWIVYQMINGTDVPSSIGDEEIIKLEETIISEFDYKIFDTLTNNLTEPDGYITYTKKR